MKHRIGFGDDSLFVMSQIFQKTPLIRRELEIHKIFFQDEEYWFISHFPQAKFVFLINGEPLKFIKKAPIVLLDHLSVIFQSMVMESAFLQQKSEKLKAKLAHDIKNLNNWQAAIMRDRKDQISFNLNKQKIKSEIKLNLITNDQIPNIIGLSVDLHLPEKIYKQLYDEMFIISLEK